jgi:hypothetical protein
LADLLERRANHISQLEDQVRHLKRDCTTFRDHITIKSTIVAANETKYRSWIAGLEDALFRHGLGDEVEGLKRAWDSSIQPVPEFPHGSGRVIKGSRKGKPIVKTEPLELTVSGPLGNQISQMDGSSRRGSISTLVQAAMVSDSTYVHPPPQVPYSNHGYQHHPPDRYMRAPPPPSLPLSRPGNQPHQSQPRVPIIYPGSMEALRQPPSPSRYVHRSRTIPTSARPTWSRNDSSSHHPNLPPPESEDRKRKRSLSGPTLHSSNYPSLPPIGSSSAPNSGQVIQSQFMLNQLEPPMASLPGSASRPVSRPTSSHQPSHSIPTAWNTLAPIRRDAAIASRPNTPSSLVHPFPISISNPSPQHMKISDLLMDGGEGHGQGGSDPLLSSVQQKSSSWPMPQVPSVKAAMPIKDLLTTGSETRTGPSKIAEPADIKPSYHVGKRHE